MKTRLLTISIFLLLGSILWAHTIILKDGKIIRGQILDQDQEVLKVKQGEDLVIVKKPDVSKVIYSNNPTVLNKILDKEKRNLIKNQRKLESKLKEERDNQNSKNSGEKKTLNVKINKIEKEIDKLEKRLIRLKQQINDMSKSP